LTALLVAEWAGLVPLTAARLKFSPGDHTARHVRVIVSVHFVGVRVNHELIVSLLQAKFEQVGSNNAEVVAHYVTVGG